MTGELDGEVLRRLRDHGPLTRTQLAQQLGVPRTTLASPLRQLTEAGDVRDGPVAASSGGRRSVTVAMPAPADRVFLALSLAERRVRVAALDGHLTIESGVSIDVQDLGDDQASMTATVLRAVDQVLRDRRPAAIGVAAAGTAPVAYVDLAGPLAERYDTTPAAAVPAARAMALGERRAGAARGIDDFVAVRLGGSVTLATMSGGRLSTGGSGHAGEVGHLRVEEFGPACVCGLTGCLDAFVSASALVAQATEQAHRGRSQVLADALSRNGALDLADLVAAGRTGDPVVVQLARDLGQRLGKVLAGVVAHADPLRVVLGGPVAALGAQLLGDLRTTVYRLAPARLAEDLDIVLSEVGDHAVLIGAGSEAVEAWIAGGRSAR
ncbi:putative NBD/HSP70 family sugar kinase [Nocardioides sp. J9]|uniref:ROK family protein n=1 Tax=Nocardioides sp. J9 TaxID=935844 RepID=UPI0011AC486B|nr:ROK family protein [Nocardioides sp. J9]TWG99009.1 putative NBD/HSP70 family sugar kinase [Nocardioides sp. J9]